MDIGESEQKTKQEESLLNPIVDLFEKIAEGVQFAQAETTTIPAGALGEISYLLILNTRGMEKACDQWEEIPVGQNTWQAFNNHFAYAYRFYHI